jgi:hypothetical protein
MAMGAIDRENYILSLLYDRVSGHTGITHIQPGKLMACPDLSAQTSLPRGLVNNNPGDLKAPPGTSWQGTIGYDADGFAQFQNVCWGLRALATDLYTKITKDGLTTISTIIPAYAPASDNNPVANYIAAVSATAGIGPTDELGTDNDTIHSLIRGIINFETGIDTTPYITDADIDTGISMMAGTPVQFVQGVAIAVTNNVDNAGIIAIGAAILLVFLLARSRK